VGVALDGRNSSTHTQPHDILFKGVIHQYFIRRCTLQLHSYLTQSQANLQLC
jgi:hypothetical protein